MKDGNHKSNKHEESLKNLLQKRQELDREVESRYTRAMAVMFTDIQGSTEFYDIHGDIDGRILLENHNSILSSILTEHRGRIIKSTGDGMMVVFEDPADSIRAAVAMQEKLLKFNKSSRKRENILVRIGINHGNVLEDEGDLYGLEVSVAARITSVANAGEILISKSLQKAAGQDCGVHCHPVSPVRVKGVSEPLELFEVIWKKEKAVNRGVSHPSAEDVYQKSKNIFVLEATKEKNKVKISGYEMSVVEQRTVRHYQEIKVDDEKINRYNADVINLLNNANQKGYLGKTLLDKLKTTGQLLYDEIFSLDLKQKLSATGLEDMIINIDDNLVNIPWELLHDGTTFLCLRFNMGRIVRTRQNISTASTREIGLPLDMLILSDPQGNLKSAYEEGYEIRNELESKEDTVNVNIRSSDINSTIFMSEVRNFDILHYAGHADYNKKDPSNSGLLMKDRKIKASDIFSMIGKRPLPSLVFSNACQSGRTEEWVLDSDFGTEIFGLANAFLLAGVRHYIGTFWNLQDEPGLHFALYFYRELINGAMIGEAVRKARLFLIERYGEDTVIWASYMLYGDPTFSYTGNTAGQKQSGQEKNPEKEKENEPLAAGSIRAADNVVVYPSRKQNWILAALALLLIMLTTAVLWSGLPWKNSSTLEKHTVAVPVSKESQAERDRRIDELVASLIKSYNEKQETGRESSAGKSGTGPPAMVLLDIRTNGVTNAEKDLIISGITDTLQQSNRIKMVERAILDKLLEELNLSSSSLADPSTALKIGRILSAKLMSTGSILRDDNDWQVSLRLVETETTSIKAAFTEIFETDRAYDVAEKIAEKLLQRVRAEYPLRAHILSTGNETIVLDAGYRQGIFTGMKMKIKPESNVNNMNAGEIEITSVNDSTSSAKIVKQTTEFKEGMTAEELL